MQPAAGTLPPAPTPVLVPVDPDRHDAQLSVEDLGSRIVGLAGRLAAATCRWLLLVAQFDAREGYGKFGLPSTARWLSFSCGLSQRTAVEHVRVARALAAVPALAAEMNAGRLSFTQVRAISRAVHEGEDDFASDLIEVARHSTASQLESLVRGLRTVEDNEQPDGPGRPQEYLTQTWTSQSQWRCQARLDPEHGAIVQSALELIAKDEGISLPAALTRMAEIAMAAALDRDTPPRGLRGHERAAVVIQLDATSRDAAPPRSAERADDSAPTAEQRNERETAHYSARIADGPGLSTSVVERLSCDARIRAWLCDEHGDVLNVGRSRRVVSQRQFDALLIRQGGHCGHPGCTSKAGLEAHHVRHWLHGGRTDLANLVLLCKAHHLGHHHDEFWIEALGKGRFRFRRADGRLLSDHVHADRLADRPVPLERDYFTIAHDAASSRWAGERLDRQYAVSVLAQRRRRACERASTRSAAASGIP